MGGPGTYHSVGSAWSCLSNTPLRMYKHFNHEGGNCSPLLVHWPKGIIDTDRWIRSPVHLIDFMPTVLEVSQAHYPKKFKGEDLIPVEGRSLVPFFNGAGIQTIVFFVLIILNQVRFGRGIGNWCVETTDIRIGLGNFIT